MYRNLQIQSREQALRHVQFLQRHKVRDTVPYAYIRFSNEAITLQACLESITSFVDRGILCYHQPLPGIEEDGSIAIAQEFVKRNPGFRLVKYRLPVIYHDSDYLAYNLFNGNIDRYWLMDSYSNYALFHLEELARENGDYNQAWLIKIDCDHIYSGKIFAYHKALVESKFYNWDMLVLTKFNIALDIRNIPDLTSIKQNYRTDNSLQSDKLDSETTNLSESSVNLPIRFIDHPQFAHDHWYVALNKFQPFVYVHFYSPDKPHLGFMHWERAQFKPNTRIQLNLQGCNSLHLKREKFNAYKGLSKEELDDFFTNKTSDYRPLELLQEVGMSISYWLDPDFWNNLDTLFRSLNYPSQEQRNLARKAADIEALVTNDELRVHAWINNFNTKVYQSQQPGNSLTPAQEQELDREYRVISKLVASISEIQSYPRG